MEDRKKSAGRLTSIPRPGGHGCPSGIPKIAALPDMGTCLRPGGHVASLEAYGHTVYSSDIADLLRSAATDFLTANPPETLTL